MHLAADTPQQDPVPVVGQAVKSGASLPLRSLKRKVSTRAQEFRVLPLRPLKRRFRAQKPGGEFDPVVTGLSLAPAAIPAPALSIEGISNDDNATVNGAGAVPPDPNGDVGPNHYVQTVNQLLQVYDKSGTALMPQPLTLNSAFTGFGGLCEDGITSDPIVLYDPLADRWFLSFLAFDADLLGNPVPPFHQCVACSQSADPTGGYYVYDFQMPNNWLNDYSKFGVWPDAYYMTDNQFDAATDDPHGTGVFAFDRAKMLTGDPNASFVFFDLEPVDPAIDGLLPADLDGPPPPTGTPDYFVCMTADEFSDPQGDALRVFEFHADFANPDNSTFTERPDSPIATAAFNPILPCGSSERDCVPQPPPAGTNSRLDALTDRLMHRLQYRNFGSNESLVVNHTVNVGGAIMATSHAAVRYYQLRRNLPGGSFTINEQASFAPDAAHRWMGSAAMDRQGNLAVGYSVSGTNVFPSIRYAGRLASDPAGGLFQGETTLQAGSGSQTDTLSRWGDYSALAVDPSDDCTFWYTTEYYATSSTRGWQTRIGKFKFTSCPPAASGTLQGMVTDAVSGLPITNAVVRTANGYSRSTGPGGTYSIPLPADTYQVTASAPSHGSKTVSGVTIANAGTTTQNFALAPVPVLVLNSSTFSDSGGNNNGGIDPNECINLNVVLQNTGLITASNILAVLSTTTAGVSISQPVSAYPNAAVGASRTNSTLFQFSTAPSFVCVAPIKLVLTVTDNGGTNMFPMKLSTGSGIGAATRFDANDTPVTISPLFGGSSSITVTGLVTSVAKVTVSLYLTSDSNGDLDIYLVGPDNTTVALVTDADSGGCAFGQDYGTTCSSDSSRTTFDDAAPVSICSGTPPFTGSYQPEESLTAFNTKSGSTVNGTWTLVVGNFAASAELECWSLFISQPSCTTGPGGCAVADTDGDGLPDWWELLYFSSTTAAVAGQDSDGDGLTNLQEFQAGTDPKNSASAFRITDIHREANNIRVTWMTGIGRTNALQRAPGGSYLTNNFAAIFTVTNTVGTVTNHLDVGAATNTPARYYRVRLVP